MTFVRIEQVDRKEKVKEKDKSNKSEAKEKSEHCLRVFGSSGTVSQKTKNPGVTRAGSTAGLILRVAVEIFQAERPERPERFSFLFSTRQGTVG